MPRFFFAILLLVLAFSVVAQNVLVYQCSAVQVITGGEEKSDESSPAKGVKELAHDKSFLMFNFRQYALAKRPPKFLSDTFVNSKGFFDKPYNPPDFL